MKVFFFRKGGRWEYFYYLCWYMRLQIYDSVKILFDNYKKKILLLRYNLSNYGLFFKGQGFKQHVIQNAQKKKLAREIKKHLSVCIVKGRGYLLTNFSVLGFGGRWRWNHKPRYILWKWNSNIYLRSWDFLSLTALKVKGVSVTSVISLSNFLSSLVFPWTFFFRL